MSGDYVPDRLYARLYQPWTLPESEWPLAKEDWDRVMAITALPWHGRVLDVGSGDGTLSALLCSRNPKVSDVACFEPDIAQGNRMLEFWGWRWKKLGRYDEFPHDYPGPFDCALCAEVLEHLTPEDGAALLKQIRGVMQPGGMLVVTTPIPGGSRAVYPGHINVMGYPRLRSMLHAAGFDARESEYIPARGDAIWLLVVAHAV